MKYTLTGLLLSISLCLQAQNNYWQQKVDNDISVTLDDKQHLLRGHISVDYYNHSPDTLKFIYFHLFPNAYKTDRTAFEKQAVEDGNTLHYFSDEKDRGYIDSLHFSVTQDAGDMQQAGVVATKDDDIVRLILPAPLAPGAHIKIETPFKVKIPLTFSRMGHAKQSYQISQWFPKPAVYDKKGWHPIPYLDQGEFYSEFGDYHVEITLPENYIVMGTGNIMNDAENAWLDSLSRLPLPKVSYNLKGTERLTDTTLNKIPASSSNLKTIVFEEQNVHDFAWFADKHWIVRKDTVAVPGTDKTVTAYTCFFPNHQKAWTKSMGHVKTAISGYSTAVGPYPYKTVKAVEGALSAGGGMEYPTVTVIAASNNEDEVKVAIVHEVGHNWFYGMLGSNERDYPWMDEGINSFYEHKFATAPPSLKSLKKDDNYFIYAMLGATHDLIPADTSAAVMPVINYGADIYGKLSYLLAWLEGYMGKEKFKEAMTDYFNQWQYKHPQPEDFRKIMQQHSDKNLDWFFDEVMTTTKPVDFKIVSVNNNDNGKPSITIKNLTNVSGPVKYNVYFYDKKAPDDIITSTAWTEPFTGTKTFPVYKESPAYEFKQVQIDAVVPDANLPNNNLHTKFKLKLFAGLNLDTVRKVWLSPMVGFNYYDGFMAGTLIHNLTIPQNKFQFAVVPLYAFGSKTFAGTGFMSYTKYYDDGLFHDIQFQISAKTFSSDKTNVNIENYIYNRFIKVAPELIFNFRKPYWRSPVERNLSLKAYWIREDQFDFTQNPTDSLYYPSKGAAVDNFYGRVQYNYNNHRTFNPYSYKLEGQIGKQFAKLSVEANLRVDYFQKNKALYIRAYAGKFFNLADNDFDSYRYRIAGTYSGQNDYLYDETYFGRNQQSGFWSQQISMKEGGFKVATLQYASQLGLTDNWLLAVNLKSDIPYIKLPVRLFADFGTFADAKQQNPSGASVLFDAGLELYISDYLSVYFPLLLSTDFKDYTKSVYTDKKFLRTITFSLNIGNINWSKMPPKIFGM
ncbi:M1 family metallopeptidase [Taibaiella lutea]|uniref:M1 family metallopeptidase n=1 Tax=Taibaiella lutea TaxID=2608001 RepID=A0A5M6CNA0_9BACT|nr:M1 family metallopeptidase [Taibaiella lutea]KAA5536486.1 M1 family metallopeptidase [Taibaiella lutea]